ncbi:ceramidase [Shewanella eurypsychrophilus]|uniref:Ceramidase n=1 Tax=Shewanella eurypsychrophilus TaxID=2593656 RepID=A0ABX6VFF3_9GAMM|nr:MULTISPECIES: ceramidase domain-containing protein [Shewanella]QFU25482.1 hypothetical protein FS418_24825 [Shewanella sp. YLB-09]QPG60624.1 ceramidase [Shewanella eurypsychrophilus]
MKTQLTHSVIDCFNLYWRHAVLICTIVISFVWIFSLDAISQDVGYHQFADNRGLLFIPHFLDLVSNLPFLIIGVLGVRFCLASERRRKHAEWSVFFIGVILVSLGSAYYHFAPSNESLLWDRLPMTLGFMGLFSALMKESLGLRVGRFILVPAIILGITSVFYWRAVDDLRLYYWVQLLPIVTIPLVLLLYKSGSSHRGYLLIGLACYLMAKITEYLDETIYLVTFESVSGHTLKHLFTAGACYSILLMLRRRLQ